MTKTIPAGSKGINTQIAKPWTATNINAISAIATETIFSVPLTLMVEHL
jgi:hypothetical protein